MKTRNHNLSWGLRAVIAVAALVPLLTFFFPLWHYFFEAPQYPEGLAMQIWTHQLTGRVDLINGLNHYVGFMHLDAADFWELRVLPVAVVLVVLGGLAAAVTGRLGFLKAWVIGYGVFAALGLTDFLRWLYQFGHTVDPKAAITMEGYTPPILGTSVFMNFYITAWPGYGAYALAAGFVLALAVLVFAWWRRREPASLRKGAALASAVLVLSLLAGCGAPKPAKVVIGQDVCVNCGMAISDPRFVAQVVSKTGKSYAFDSIECMVAFLTKETIPAGDVHSAWVTDYNRPGTWLPAEEARYLQSAGLRSPMGLNLSAFAKLGELEDVRAEVDGIERRYGDLAGIVIDAGFLERGQHGHEPMSMPVPAGSMSPAQEDGDPSGGAGAGSSE